MKLARTLLGTLLLAPLAGLQAGDASKPPRQPNVIVLLTDDQGYGDLGCHGNPVIQTPHLDRLAHESVRFSNFHVDSYCTPTRAALMTGRYAHRVGGWGTVCGHNMLRDDEVTMADVFRHNGYRTGHFGKWHLGTNYPYRPIDRGFDQWLGHGDGGTGCTTDHWGNDRVNDTSCTTVAGRIHRAPATRPTCSSTPRCNSSARTSTGRSSSIWPATPHSPCSVADLKWAAPYRDKVPANVADFYASIARVDENLGRLRAFLQAEGLRDNTLLIFLTDNGSAEGDKVFNAGMHGEKGSPYDGGHRVPVSSIGRRAGSTSPSRWTGSPRTSIGCRRWWTCAHCGCPSQSASTAPASNPCWPTRRRPGPNVRSCLARPTTRLARIRRRPATEPTAR